MTMPEVGPHAGVRPWWGTMGPCRYSIASSQCASHSASTAAVFFLCCFVRLDAAVCIIAITLGLADSRLQRLRLGACAPPEAEMKVVLALQMRLGQSQKCSNEKHVLEVEKHTVWVWNWLPHGWHEIGS